MEANEIGSLVHEILETDAPREPIKRRVSDSLNTLEILDHIRGFAARLQDTRMRRSVAERLFRAFPNSVACIDLYCEAFRDSLSAGELVELRRRGAGLSPRDKGATMRLADALIDAGRAEQAVDVIRAAQAFGGPDEFLDFRLGYHHARRGEHASALQSYEAALRKAVTVRTLQNMASSYRHTARFAESRSASKRALTIEPRNADAHYNFANLERELADPRKAAGLNRRAECIAPGNFAAKWNLSHALLADGQFAAGFSAYRHRWWFPGFPTRVRYPDIANVNAIDELSGRVLLYAEQGRGDNMLFARFIKHVQTALPQGAELFVETFADLRSLFENSFPDTAFVEYASPLPAGFDHYLPLFEVPRLLGLNAAFGESVPYLKPTDGEVPTALDAARPRVGVVWAGNPDFVHDRDRSARLDDLDGLFVDPGLSFHCLQKGPDEGLIAARHGQIRDLAPWLDSFDMTARFIERMDFVVSTCTSTANLAGAMGRPGLVLASHVRDWRWMTGPISAWYPSLRIVEKPRARSWKDFLAELGPRLRAELAPGAGA